MTIFGIDVSRFQGSINWNSVYNAGIRFATIKASEGSSSQTAAETVSHFRTEFPKARNAGVTVGAYHVIRSGSVSTQLNFFESQLSAVGTNPRDIIVQWDYEDWGYDFPSYAQVKSVINTFATRHGVRGILYTGKWVWDRVTGEPANAAADLNVKLWNSNYGTNPNVGYTSAYPGDGSTRWNGYGGWTSATILQYGSKCIVSGVSGGCDANAYKGTLAQFRTQFIASEGDTDMEATENVPITTGSWMLDYYSAEPNVTDGLLVQTCLTEGYGYSRMGHETSVTRDNTLSAKIDTVQAKVDNLSVSGVDTNLLATKVADLLAQDLQS